MAPSASPGPAIVLDTAAAKPLSQEPKELSAASITFNLVPDDLQAPVPAQDDPVRGQQSCNSAHMLTANWTAEGGWERPEIKSYGPLLLNPAASVLHYGTESFVSFWISISIGFLRDTPDIAPGRNEALSWARQ